MNFDKVIQIGEEKNGEGWRDGGVKTHGSFVQHLHDLQVPDVETFGVEQF